MERYKDYGSVTKFFWSTKNVFDLQIPPKNTAKIDSFKN